MQRSTAFPTSTRCCLWLLLVCAIMIGASGPSARASTTPAGALFPNMATDTRSAAIQVDSSGGMHGAYKTDPASQATYTYCPPTADCSQPNNWAQATFQNNVLEVQIGVTPLGHPRMLLMIHNDGNGLQDTYWYAQCDTNCTSSTNWVTTFIASSGNTIIGALSEGKHYFALDPQGRPRFVFGPDPIDNRMTYATCDSSCTATGAIDPHTGLPTPVNWSFGKINATFYQPALAFTTAGHPRVAGFFYDGVSQTMIYSTCDTGCTGSTSSANWTTSTVGQGGLGSNGNNTVSLRITSHDQPRAALYDESIQATYLWCNSNCTIDSNWGSVPIVPTAGDGSAPDLQLDNQDHPRVAFRSAANPPGGLGYGLGYAWCDTNCESPGATFQRKLVDDSVQLQSDWPHSPHTGCTSAGWLAGSSPILALDPAGNPRIASDNDVVAGCPTGAVTLQSAVRFVYFNQGSTPGGNRVFVPWVRR